MGNDDLQSIFSVGCQGHIRFRSKMLVLDSINFSYFGPPTSIELKNHMKFMWNSRVVNCRSKPFMTDTKYLILWTRWIGPKYWFILIVESYRISIWHFLPKRTSNHAILKIKLKMFTLQNFCLLFIYQVMAYIYL